jgi:hypothetical protein
MWDAFQREMLTALGHTVFVPAAATPVETMSVESTPVGSMSVPVTTAANAAQPALLRALVRAAGVDAERLGDLPPLDQLRDATAKRALWPRLRAMRGAAQP